MAWHSMLTDLECARCGHRHDADRLINLCSCGGPLLARYDLESVARAVDPGKLTQRTERSLWRYRELLPVRAAEHVVSLGEGGTPLLGLDRLGAVYGVPQLYMKDEGLNPTGTFKARGATTGVSRAKELGASSIAMPTNGNAGGAWAAYGAKAGLEVALCMPVDAPPLAVAEAAVANARIALVRGQISDAGAIMGREAPQHGWFETATLKEPYRIEGKKTMGYEIVEDLDWTLPDAIVYPTGGGVGIIGIYKALREMRAMGWIDGKLPRLFAVQAAGCAPIVAAYEAGQDTSEPWPDAETIAQGIRVPSALGDFLVLEAVRETGGSCLAVTDEAILAALHETGRAEGCLICPEGAAAVAAVPMLLAQQRIGPDDRVVILNTGTGMKYPGVIDVSPPVIDPADPLPPEVVQGHIGDQSRPAAVAAGPGQVRGGESAAGQHSPQPVLDAEQRLHDQVREVVHDVHCDLPGGPVRHGHPGPVERGGLAFDEGDLDHSPSLAPLRSQAGTDAGTGGIEPDGGSTGTRVGTVSG